MGKKEQIPRKTIVVMKNKHKYRIFDEDLKKIIKVRIRKIPNLPRF
jgi:predicted small metal-binding protein